MTLLTLASCLTLATCYQLVKSVLKTGFALAKKDGIGRGEEAEKTSYLNCCQHMLIILHTETLSRPVYGKRK